MMHTINNDPEVSAAVAIAVNGKSVVIRADLPSVPAKMAFTNPLKSVAAG